MIKMLGGGSMTNNVVECSAENCLHNNNNMCNAQYINVIPRKAQDKVFTNCKTFEPKEFNTSLTNMTNINITGAIDQIFTEEQVMNPNIRCGVSQCVFNHQYVCNATGINIGDYTSTESFETRCKTYRHK